MTGALHGKIDATFARHRVQLTLGGEPTYVPIEPVGSEWSLTAIGPTKLRYARALAAVLIAQTLPGALAVFAPGKMYPGEVNPRWAIQLLWRHDGRPLVDGASIPGRASAAVVARFRTLLLRALRLKAPWLRGVDPLDAKGGAWVLPLDHDGARFRSEKWALGRRLELIRAEGPAGLRLPLGALPAKASRRALTLEVQDGQLDVFLPPLRQAPWIALLALIVQAARAAECGPLSFSSYVPPDDAGAWSKLGITPDPGVLEINLPPCPACGDYDRWMAALESACAVVGLRSFKRAESGEEAGTGGGNHLLLGGPTLETNPLFTHPRWVTSILRYWQHHPSLSYLFTGSYVGSSSQAPRPDESAAALYDLELAYSFLANLPRGDHRELIGETLRHLHTDSSGNTHRSEICFDKFWNRAFDGGCRGLIEFRAVETLPSAEWMAAVALLWRALAAHLLAAPFTNPLVDHGLRLHDSYFLPAFLWADFAGVLRDLRAGGFELPVEVYRRIADWRFPVLLDYREGRGRLTVRKAHESWPLLCETPLEGGNTSRFVDTSIERLEFLANTAFVESCALSVQGRALAFQKFPGGQFGLGLRYRRTALHPSLHPGIRPHMPLMVTIEQEGRRNVFTSSGDQRAFRTADPGSAPKKEGEPMRKAASASVTFDLRLP